MKLFLTCSDDTYITNKIIDNSRKEDSNVGKAGTLDLFKLYDESSLNGADQQIELSRILIKFDLTKLKNQFENKIDINHQSFSAKLKLFDITSGNALPSDFNVTVFPLRNSFTEGYGKDIGTFSDNTVASFLHREYSDGANVAWNAPGANEVGDFSNQDIDCIETATINEVQVNFKNTQNFKIGNENLEIDVTESIKSMLLEDIPDNGFRISFEPSEETDQKTRFVKRFASRHVSNPHLIPRIEISYDDSIKDNHSNFIFDYQGSLYLENIVRSERANIKSGLNGNELSGPNCMKLKLQNGLFEELFDVSSVTQGTNSVVVPGLYKVEVNISAANETYVDQQKRIIDLVSQDGKVDFQSYWQSVDASQVFHTGSLTISKPHISTGTLNTDIIVHSTNLKSEYKLSDFFKVRLFAKKSNKDFFKSGKYRAELKSEILNKCYYRVIDIDTSVVALDFGEADNSTIVSTDKEGMFFNFDFSVLPYGRSYAFEYKVSEGTNSIIIRDDRSRFRVI